MSEAPSQEQLSEPDVSSKEKKTNDIDQDIYYPMSFTQFDAKPTTIPLGPSGFGMEASLQVIEAH